MKQMRYKWTGSSFVSFLHVEGCIFCACCTDLSHIMHFFFFASHPFSCLSIYFHLQRCWVPGSSPLRSWEQARSSRWGTRRSSGKPAAWCCFAWQLLMNHWSFDSPCGSLSIEVLGIYLKLACSLPFYSAWRISTLQKMFYLIPEEVGWSSPLACFSVPVGYGGSP